MGTSHSDSQRQTERDLNSSANHAVIMMAQATLDLAESFLIESGASDHMTSKVEVLSDVRRIKPRAVTMGNGSTVTATHSGTLHI